VNAFREQEWDQVFSGNRTRLKVVGMERLGFIFGSTSGLSLPYVLSLDMSFEPHSPIRYISSAQYLISTFVQMLENLEEIDLSFITVDRSEYLSLSAVLNACTNLKKITCCGSQGFFVMGGMRGIQACNNLTEMYLDDSYFGILTVNVFSIIVNPGRFHLFYENEQIERLSINNITWKRTPRSAVEPVTQGMLVKMVRTLPKLRWLRSDLSAENVAMLQKERPEITFVSD
jgi:hypothetical protein